MQINSCKKILTHNNQTSYQINQINSDQLFNISME